MKHTPGPWRVTVQHRTFVKFAELFDPKGFYIQSYNVFGPDGEHIPLDKEHARLIAAAPKLADALRLFIEAYEPFYVSAMADDSERTLLDEAMDAARTALAAAGVEV